MPHRRLFALALLGLTLTSLPAAAQPTLDIAALRLATAGRWAGKLDYLDYSTHRWFGLPMTVLIEDQGDGVTLIRKADFDDGPQTGTVRITTVQLFNPATGQETSASFRKARDTSLDTADLRLAAPATDATHWTLIAERTGRDGDRPARLRETTTRDGEVMTSLKEVDFLDDAAETWISRNRSTLKRLAD